MGRFGDMLGRKTSVLLLVFSGVLLLCRSGYALVERVGCLGGDFGDECSLAELKSNDANIRIDAVVFGSFSASYYPPGSQPLPDDHRIRVVPTGEGTTAPGLRFEAVDQWQYTSRLNEDFFNASLYFAVRTSYEYTGGAEPPGIVSLTLHPQASTLSSGEGDSFQGVIVTGRLQLYRAFSPPIDDVLWGVPENQPPHFGWNAPIAGATVTQSLPVPLPVGGTQIGVFTDWELAALQMPYAFPGEDFGYYGAAAAIRSLTYTLRLTGLPSPLPPISSPEPGREEYSSGAVQNGTFQSGLEGWTGPASLRAVPGGNVAVLGTEISPVALCQTMEVPPRSYMIDYNYRFTEVNGALEVTVQKGTDPAVVIDRVGAGTPVVEYMTHRRAFVNDPMVMASTDSAAVNLCFTLHPGSPSGAEIGNVDSPYFVVLESTDVSAEVIDALLAGAGGSCSDTAFEGHDFSAAAEVELQGDGGGCPTGWYLAAGARGAVSPLTGGIQWGTRAYGIAHDPAGEANSSAHQAYAHTFTTVQMKYRVVVPGDNEPYPLGFRMRVHGNLHFYGNLPASGPDVLIQNQGVFQVRAEFGTRRAQTVATGNGYNARIAWVDSLLEVEEGGDLSGGRVVVNSESPSEYCGNEDTSPALAIIEETENRRTYELYQDKCLDPVLYVTREDVIEVKGKVNLESYISRRFAESMPLGEAMVDADFARTVSVDVYSTNPEVQLVPLGLPGSDTDGDGVSDSSDLCPTEAGLSPSGCPPHSCDYNPGDWAINLSELLRTIQFYNSGEYSCDPQGEDGYTPGLGDRTCVPHASDYNPQDWSIGLSELLRAIQLYNSGGYHPDPTTEDGFAPGL